MSLFKPSLGQFPTATIAPEEYAIPLLRPDRWFEEAAEGELAVDVYETAQEYVVQSTLAGVHPEDLTLSLQRDLLTIRGVRHQPWPERFTKAVQSDEMRDKNLSCLTQECYWGNFSRSILLPEPIDMTRAEATLKQGVLTITLPKLEERTRIDVSEIT